ncbi:hypothetical protein ACKWTF_014673 [Chironomus riparius]
MNQKPQHSLKTTPKPKRPRKTKNVKRTAPRPKKIYSCDLCGRQFFKKHKIQFHMTIRHLIHYTECKICNKKLRSYTFKGHILSHATERNFQCKICDKKFRTNDSLKNHISSHNKPHECSTCGKKFALKARRNKHEQGHQQRDFKVLECELCGMKFLTKQRLKCHQRNHEEKSTKSLKCLRCNFSTDNKIYFKRHQKSHELKDKKAAQIKNPINCEKCPAVLRNKQALRCHMINCHPIAPYECDLCGRVINARTNFIKHINYHLYMKKLQVD